jgi:hypothetical protein
VLVDDLTRDMIQVLATGDSYDGSTVAGITILAAEGACGHLLLRVDLADRRSLLVVLDPQAPQLKTVLTVVGTRLSPPNGQPIDGAQDRFVGSWLNSEFNDGQLLLDLGSTMSSA